MEMIDKFVAIGKGTQQEFQRHYNEFSKEHDVDIKASTMDPVIVNGIHQKIGGTEEGEQVYEYRIFYCQKRSPNQIKIPEYTKNSEDF